MIVGMWCSNTQTVEFLSGGEIDLHTFHERLSYAGGSSTAIRATHSDSQSHRRNTNSLYKQHHIDAGEEVVFLSRKTTRSTMSASTGLSVQLRNKD